MAAVIDFINANYSGCFGPFEADESNEEDFATALHPIPGNRHTEGNRITFSVESEIAEEYANRVEFVDDKTKPSIMGKPVDVERKFGFDEEHGRLNNFSMMGAKGGYVFFAARKDDVLFCAELHTQKRHMTDDDMKEFMDVVISALAQ